MPPAQGLVLICDTNGIIQKVLYCPAEWEIPVAVGRPFPLLAVPGSMTKALSFLNQLRGKGTAFGWEINISSAGQARMLHFIGGTIDQGWLIAGSETSEEAQALYEDMLRISNEQTNALRAAHKEIALSAQLYDEISRLNNELISTQRELAKRNAELERLNEEKNRFLGMAAHDLRNPLHTILSASEFLLEAEELTLEQQRFLTIIRDSSEFVAHLIDDLLDVAQIQAGTLKLNLEPTDMRQVVERAVLLNQSLAERKTITITYALSPVPLIPADRAKLLEVLNNLLSNAIKFSYPGGTIEVRLWQEQEEVLCSVQDHGQGIPPEVQARLFKPFQRGVSGTAGEKSTGLGLTIVKMVVEGHGGRIWYVTQPGQGTTFSVALPIRNQG